MELAAGFGWSRRDWGCFTWTDIERRWRPSAKVLLELKIRGR